MVQYPYELWSQSATTTPTRDDKGHWLDSGVQAWTLLGRCRDELNAAAARITLPDGSPYVYSAEVVAPLAIVDIPLGSPIEVRYRGKVRLAAKVKGFVRKQLHVKLWV